MMCPGYSGYWSTCTERRGQTPGWACPRRTAALLVLLCLLGARPAAVLSDRDGPFGCLCLPRWLVSLEERMLVRGQRYQGCERVCQRSADSPKGSAEVKLVIAIIQPTKLQAVREALQRIEVTRMTVCDAQGFGQQRGQKEMYRGSEYRTMLLRKVALEIVVNDDFLERTIETIINAARTGPEGNIGDGKIFVVPAMEAIQLSDGSRGPGAV